MFDFGPNPNSGKPGHNQSQPDNSNTNTNTFLSLTAPFVLISDPTIATQQTSRFGGGLPSISIRPAAHEDNRPSFPSPALPQSFGQPSGLFGRTGYNQPIHSFGQCEAVTGQRDSSTNGIFGGAMPAVNPLCLRQQAGFPAVNCGSFGHVHNQGCINQNIIIVRKMREEMRGLAERIRILEEYQGSESDGIR